MKKENQREQLAILQNTRFREYGDVTELLQTVELLEEFADGYELVLAGSTAAGLDKMREFTVRADNQQAPMNQHSTLTYHDIMQDACGWLTFSEESPEYQIFTAAVMAVSKIMGRGSESEPEGEKTETEKNYTKKQIREMGIDVEPHDTQAILTGAGLRYALAPFTQGQLEAEKRNKKRASPSIYLIPEEKTNVIEAMINGRWNTISEAAIEEYAKNAVNVDCAVLRQLFTVALRNKYKFVQDMKIEFWLKGFCEELGVAYPKTTDNPNKNEKKNNIQDKIREFTRCVAIWPDENGRAQEVLHMIEFYRGKVTFISPYFQTILNKDFLFSCLLYSRVSAERNRTAVDVLVWLLQGLEERGEYNKTPGQPITYEVSFQGIIDHVRSLEESLNGIKLEKHKNAKLKSTFQAVYRLFHTCTKCEAAYKDFAVAETIPTMKTLGDKFTITHNGRNKERPTLD